MQNKLNQGFILFVVLGLIATLALIILFFVENSQQNKNLSNQYLIQIRANLVTLAGYDYGKRKYLENIFDFDSKSHLVHVGPGTFIPNGDVATVEIKDTNARININDGLTGGKLEEIEIGNTYYPNALDPYPLNHLSRLHPGGNGFSGLSNIRIRRLLNAYGEVHRFTDQVCHGDHNKLNESYGQLPSPIFSTPASLSADGEKGTQMAHYVPNSDPLDHKYDLNLNTGLGDHIIAQRPQGGYGSLEEIKTIVNNWSILPTVNISKTYLNEFDFYDLIKEDLTVSSFEDYFSRLGYFKHFERDINSTAAKGNCISTDIHQIGSAIFYDNSTSGNLFVPNSVALINLNQASFFVKAAIFYAPTHMNYSMDTASTMAPYLIGTPSSDITVLTGVESMIPYSMIGSIGPMFIDGKEKRLNGIDDVGRSSHLMSLRDAMHLAHAYETYTHTNKSIMNFDDFKDFLIDHEINGFLLDGTPPYERVLSTNPYAPYTNLADFNAGSLFHVAPYQSKGIFLQDYVSKTLPHILSCIRRIPSWYGAPIALQSPYMTHKPDYNNPSTPIRGRQGFRKVEDFVSRLKHPKVCFIHCGTTELTSQGSIKDDSDQLVVSNRIKATFNFFDTKYFRTQNDFVGITTYDSVNASFHTDHEIVIGPEFYNVNSPNLSNSNVAGHIGVVGLKDFDQDLNLDPFMQQEGGYDPQLVMNFSHDSLQEPPKYGLENDSLNTTVKPDPITKVTQDKWYETLDSTPYHEDFKSKSLLEVTDANYKFKQFKGQGNRYNDLSPFNGIRFTSIGHGLFDLDANPMDDSLYWRLEDWLDDNQPIGQAIAKGFMTFWFRLPTGYDYPTVVYGFDDKIIRSQSYSRVLVQLNVWEKYEYDTSATDLERPIAITVGIKKTPRYGMGVFARYDSGGEHFHPSNPALYKGALVDGKDFVTLKSSKYADQKADDLGLWLNSDNLLFHESGPYVYEAYRWAAHRSCEVIVPFANQPECGPGSWHRVSVYWNLGWNSLASEPSTQDQLYIDLHDQSNKKEDQEFRHGVAYAPLPPASYTAGDRFNYPQNLSTVDEGANVGFMLPFNETMILSLGESHARYLGNYFFEKQTYSFDDIDPQYNYYRSFWRLDSCLDNFRFWMGPKNSPISDKYFKPEFISSTVGGNPYSALRYKITHKDIEGFDQTHEPQWIIDPKIEKKSQILAVGTRIYYPPDSNNNVPYISLAASNDENNFIPLKHSSISQNEQNLFFNDTYSSDYFRLRLRYKAFTPTLDGDLTNMEENLLVYSGTDNVTAIPWIKELSIRYIPSQGPRLLSYETNDVLTITSQTSEDDDDDDDDDDDGGQWGGPPPK